MTQISKSATLHVGQDGILRAIGNRASAFFNSPGPLPIGRKCGIGQSACVVELRSAALRTPLEGPTLS
jgi:hypothetical protein